MKILTLEKHEHLLVYAIVSDCKPPPDLARQTWRRFTVYVTGAEQNSTDAKTSLAMLWKNGIRTVQEPR